MRDYKANTFQMDSSIFRFGLTPIQFVVYSYLIYCAGNRCACSIKLQTIASVCECSRSSVKRALNVLRDREFIDIKGGAQKLRGKGHRQTCNRYYCLDSSEWKTSIAHSLDHAAQRGRDAFGTATRISASLSRRLSAFFWSTPGQDPKAAKFAVLPPGHAGFPKRVKQSEGSNSAPI